MPVPTKNTRETDTQFLSRCISTLHRTDPERPQNQIVAMCYSQLRREDIHPDFLEILSKFINFFGVEGITLYHDFLRQNKLDEDQPYTPAYQMRESFDWARSFIKYWKHDKEASYFRMRILSANVSMNLNAYTDPEHMKYATSNLSWRPLNLDHEHKLRLSFPNNRLEIGRISEEGNSIEGVIRITHAERSKDTGKLIQDLIKTGEILHPSIEAHPICGMHMRDGQRVPTCGYYLDEIALLRKARSLPGDVLSKVFAMPLNESMGRSLVESLGSGKMVDGEIVCTEKICEIEEKKLVKDKEKEDEVVPDSEVERAKAHFKLSDAKWDTLTDKQKKDFIDKLPRKDAEVSKEDENLEIRLREEIIKRDKVNEMLQRKISEGFAREEELKRLKDDAETNLVTSKGEIQRLIGEAKDYEKTVAEEIDGLKVEIIEGKTKFESDAVKTGEGYEESLASLTVRHNTERTGLIKLHTDDVTRFMKEIETLKDASAIETATFKADLEKDLDEAKQTITKENEDLKAETTKTIEELNTSHTEEITKLTEAKETLETELTKQVEDAKAESTKTVEELKTESTKTVEELTEAHAIEVTKLSEAKETLTNDLTTQIEDIKAESTKTIDELKTVQVTELAKINESKEGLQNDLTMQIDALKTKEVTDKAAFNEKYLRTKETLEGKLETVNETFKDTKGYLNDCKRINLELKGETVAAKENEDKALSLMRDTQKRNEELSTVNRTQQEELSAKLSEMETINNRYVRQLSDNDKLRATITELKVSNRKQRNLVKQIIRVNKKDGELLILEDGTIINDEYVDAETGNN